MRDECRELYTLADYQRANAAGDFEAHSMANLISCTIGAEERGGSVKWHRHRWAEIVARKVMEAATQCP